MATTAQPCTVTTLINSLDSVASSNEAEKISMLVESAMIAEELQAEQNAVTAMAIEELAPKKNAILMNDAMDATVSDVVKNRIEDVVSSNEADTNSLDAAAAAGMAISNSWLFSALLKIEHVPSAYITPIIVHQVLKELCFVKCGEDIVSWSIFLNSDVSCLVRGNFLPVDGFIVCKEENSEADIRDFLKHERLVFDLDCTVCTPENSRFRYLVNNSVRPEAVLKAMEAGITCFLMRLDAEWVSWMNPAAANALEADENVMPVNDAMVVVKADFVGILNENVVSSESEKNLMLLEPAMIADELQVEVDVGHVKAAMAREQHESGDFFGRSDGGNQDALAAAAAEGTATSAGWMFSALVKIEQPLNAGNAFGRIRGEYFHEILAELPLIQCREDISSLSLYFNPALSGFVRGTFLCLQGFIVCRMEMNEDTIQNYLTHESLVFELECTACEPGNPRVQHFVSQSLRLDPFYDSFRAGGTNRMPYLRLEHNDIHWIDPDDADAFEDNVVPVNSAMGAERNEAQSANVAAGSTKVAARKEAQSANVAAGSTKAGARKEAQSANVGAGSTKMAGAAGRKAVPTISVVSCPAGFTKPKVPK